MIKIGMMIGERYEILEKIGTGGMSDVYKAKCHKLNRFVAVKVLKQEFSENANFVSKFRIEAQAAAGLMHPNIVNVYDVGEENGIYYIVMELVEGITLKKYIEKKARLSYKEAVSIAIQVSMGIEAAHNNHIIHRDIKPQNIIISKDGKVKVTDFGIAKAATSNTITSNVMGSVHYTSPEQARGGYSDEKSDIYSLGISMFEMLTGRVPFNGETTVAIAIKHIQEEIPSPKEFIPEIPSSVDSIVLKCCQKSPERRYQSMAELIADLKQSLMKPEEDFVVQNEPDMNGSTRMISEGEMAQIKRRTAYQEEYPGREETMRLRANSETARGSEEKTEEGEDYDYNYNPKMERVTTILAVAAGVVICIFVIILAISVFRNLGKGSNLPSSPIQTDEAVVDDSSEDVEYVPMPVVVGKAVEEARNILADLGLKSEVNYEESDEIEVGIVISADVATGEQVVKGSTIVLTASSGPESVKVPLVTELTYEEAYSKLTGLGFAVTKVENYSDTVAVGMVMQQVPVNDSMVAKGTNVTLTVSLGAEEEKVPVPNLMGRPEAEVTAEITTAKLTVGTVSYVYSNDYAAGLICYQSYSHGSWVESGTKVDIKVSQGPVPETLTYKCNASISAPTSSEAPDFVPGSSVALKLVADDGTVLLETTTSNFPYAANYYGLSSTGGTLTMTYTATTSGSTGTDGDGNEVAIPGVTEDKSFNRRIEFTAE